MNSFKSISASELTTENIFDLISKKWMLLTAGSENSFNTMTASWGFMGFLWGKNVTACFVRPERHTFKFMEQQNFYTLSFYDEKYKDVLNYCGTHSGKDVDKIKETGLSPIFNEPAPYFKESNLVFVCKKVYADYIKKDNILDASLVTDFYSNNGYHKMYIGEIVSVFQRS